MAADTTDINLDDESNETDKNSLTYTIRMVDLSRRIITAVSWRTFGYALPALALIYLVYTSFSSQPHINLDHQSTGTTDDMPVSFVKQVKPVLDKRCVVCHSCYDAPCQLKLSSIAGISRGANREKIYNPKRLTAIAPTRLFIDARSDSQWRNKGFHSVVEAEINDTRSYNKSVLQMLLDLKNLHPLPAKGKLPESFTLDIDREQECPTHESFYKYANENPLWGMPYAMPELSKHEYRILSNWLENGAPMDAPAQYSHQAAPQIKLWENFLNQPSSKNRLVSRYIYEHIFHSHIYFSGTPENEFYRLVRSRTPPDTEIDEIATLRPYDDPGSAEFYYRIQAYTPTIVAKNHIVYELSDERLQRYQQLFIDPKYDVAALPSYAPDVAANPFRAFADIPPDSRYRFLLDDARFFIEGFIKGPVCRGQIALNVIEDRFWVVFFDPDREHFTTQASFLNNMTEYLRIPSERESHMNLLPIWTDYWQQQKQYIMSKQQFFEKINTHDIDHALSYIWDGDGTNPNAALTVLRHFDSGSVEYGFIGNEPETAWVIDYPLLERIHYLLVAGFNVYGNVVHQLSTRIYMDFLRMEGEDHFLAFLPANKRKLIRDSWYQGMRSELDVLFKAPMDWLKIESVIGYQTNDVKSELYHHIKKRLGNLLQFSDSINQCGNSSCIGKLRSTIKPSADRAMREIEKNRGRKLHAFPEVSFVRVVTDNPEQSFAYSIIRNKAYKNVVSLLSDERERVQQDIDKDSLTVLNWLAGSYPNFFFTVHVKDINLFITQCTAIKTQVDYDRFVEQFGIRRTSPVFWETADWFQARYKQQRPLHSGLYDLSRYSNL